MSPRLLPGPQSVRNGPPAKRACVREPRPSTPGTKRKVTAELSLPDLQQLPRLAAKFQHLTGRPPEQ